MRSKADDTGGRRYDLSLSMSYTDTLILILTNQDVCLSLSMGHCESHLSGLCTCLPLHLSHANFILDM